MKSYVLKSISLFVLFLSFYLVVSGHNSERISVKDSIPIIPEPLEVKVGNGFFKIDSVSIFGDVSDKNVSYKIDKTMTSLGEEGYSLEINSGGIQINAPSEAGIFYGKMTLRQLYANGSVPYIIIKDKPRFPYRGLLLDVSRHFFTKEEVKKMIDLMSLYKLNRFQWHLTDTGGWRFEVDSYPDLTKETSHRTHKIWRDWRRSGSKYLPVDDPNGYGGFYTKENIKEVIKYAAERNIIIIPEIEFPGHSDEVLAAYPELSCEGKPYSSGVFCAGNKDTYVFMEKVLNEVMELFPSQIINIGGDETSTASWRKCPKCQALMKEENMTDVHELHSYIIRKAENIIQAKGRRLAGWDEILHDKLGKESIALSWTGVEQGIEAARKGYDVVMTPLHYLYIDYFQSSPNTQPFGHDGYTTLEKVYSFNPTPKDLNETEKQHIIGVQGSLWTEWIYEMKHLEYMAFPRTLALAEIAWSPQESHSWDGFRKRVEHHLKKLNNMGVSTYSLSCEAEPVMHVDTIKKQLEVSLKSEKLNMEIRYTTDGSIPTKTSPLYKSPIIIKDSIHIKASSFENGSMCSGIFDQNYYYHKGIGKDVKTNGRTSAPYILTDGYIGGYTYLDGSWFNFYGDRELTLDLGKEDKINKIKTRWMQLRAGANRSLPESVELLLSNDGVNYTSYGTVNRQNIPNTPVLQFQNFDFEGNWTTRYIRLKIKSGGSMSVDEIIVL